MFYNLLICKNKFNLFPDSGKRGEEDNAMLYKMVRKN